MHCLRPCSPQPPKAMEILLLENMGLLLNSYFLPPLLCFMVAALLTVEGLIRAINSPVGSILCCFRLSLLEEKE